MLLKGKKKKTLIKKEAVLTTAVGLRMLKAHHKQNQPNQPNQLDELLISLARCTPYAKLLT